MDENWNPYRIKVLLKVFRNATYLSLFQGQHVLPDVKF